MVEIKPNLMLFVYLKYFNDIHCFDHEKLDCFKENLKFSPHVVLEFPRNSNKQGVDHVGQLKDKLRAFFKLLLQDEISINSRKHMGKFSSVDYCSRTFNIPYGTILG